MTKEGHELCRFRHIRDAHLHVVRLRRTLKQAKTISEQIRVVAKSEMVHDGAMLRKKATTFESLKKLSVYG